MNWELFKQKYNADITDESKFIVGLDIGNSSSSISYFDFKYKEPVVIDISGGYGKSSVPTAVQYLKDSSEWTFGEYAVLNKGAADEITFQNLISNIGTNMYYEIDNNPVSLTYILGLYVKDLIENIKNINPNAELVGIAAAVHCYMSEEEKSDLLAAFKAAGIEDSFIGFVSDRESIIQYYCFENDFDNKNVLLLDFADRAVRGGIYSLSEEEKVIKSDCIATMFSNDLSIDSIENEIIKIFTQYYKDNVNENFISENVKSQIEAFAYQHKDLIFQNNKNKKVKLYFNFCYPPFQKVISEDEIETLLKPFKIKLNNFINSIFDSGDIDKNNIDCVLCSGGGFEMIWAKDLIKDNFDKDKAVFFKSSKTVISKGACLYAAVKLNVLNEKNIFIADKHQLNYDLGIMVNEGSINSFVPLAERNSFWWQKHNSKTVIINDYIKENTGIEIFVKGKNGNTELLKKVFISGLPERPKGTTRLCISAKYQNFNEPHIIVSDLGFGELFPKSEYKEEFILKVGENIELGRV